MLIMQENSLLVLVGNQIARARGELRLWRPGIVWMGQGKAPEEFSWHVPTLRREDAQKAKRAA
jgi:hypothetical protein